VAAAVASLEAVSLFSRVTERGAAAQDAASDGIPDVQFDISPFIGPATTVDGVLVRFGPVHTVFATAALHRGPDRRLQSLLDEALNRVEQAYPWSPQGVFSQVAYGEPYFRRLPAGLVAEAMPRLVDDAGRFALETAQPGPTDVDARNPGITKERFNVPVRLEDNDLLFTFRSDDAGRLSDVVRWLAGSDRLHGGFVRSPDFGDRLRLTSVRFMFVQPGLPRRLAHAHRMPFAHMVNPQSPMWMGFADQQVSASAPAPFVTFQGADGFTLTTARAGDYFDNGSIQHLAHVILDLQQFYDVDDNGTPGDDASFTERVQYMFRSTPPPSLGFPDQITDGGGPAFLENDFRGFDDAERSAQGIGTPNDERRIGHISALQRVSRTRDGRPIHLRIDGPGLDSMDVPDGSMQPKLHFSMFVPTSSLFAKMRRRAAAQDLQKRFQVKPDENGLERFSSATRRQNFLVPPRRHRSLPLVELI
jgi:hypothetical protein